MPTALGLSCSSHCFPRKEYPTGAFSLAASCSTSSRASRQPSPPKIATFFAASIIPASLSRSASAGRNTGGAGIVISWEESSGAFADAMSPGIEITVGPLSTTAVRIAVVTTARTCSGLTTRPT